MTADVRTRIVDLFEKHRAMPGAPYEQSHFLDYLIANPKGRNAVYNSFRGLRRFNAFIDEVQYEFGIHFSIADRESNLPLDRFVERVLTLQQSPRGSLKSLANRTRAGPGWQVLLVADLILLTIAILARQSFWALAAIAVIALAVNLGFAGFAWRERTYLRRLGERLGNR